MSKFEVLEKSMLHELEAIEQKLQGGVEMSIQDLEKANKLAHTLKCMATYCAMKEADEYREGGYSGMRSHEAGAQTISQTRNGYADGYSEGYSEAMRQMNGNSGYYPVHHPEYPRRW